MLLFWNSEPTFAYWRLPYFFFFPNRFCIWDGFGIFNNKSISDILEKFNNRERKNICDTDSESDSETESEKRKRLLCEEVGNRASVNNLKYVCKLFV